MMVNFKLGSLLTPIVVVVCLVQLSWCAPASEPAKLVVPAAAPAAAPAVLSRSASPPPASTTEPDHGDHHDGGKPCTKPGVSGDVEEYYDQRQNGTHNIRVEIDNIVILHAPLDIGGGGGSSTGDDDEEVAAFLQQLALLAETEATSKPPATTDVEATTAASSSEEEGVKPAAVKKQKRQRTKVRLASLLAPLLRNHH